MAKEVTPEQIEMLDGMVAKARAAAEIIATYDQERVDRLCQAVAASVIDMKVWANLADEAVDETGLGDKVTKRNKRNKLKLILRDCLRQRSVGVIEEIPEKGIVKYAKPVGVIASLVPTTNPCLTPAGQVIYAIKARDVIICSPHPRAKKTTNKCINIIRETLVREGAPADIIQGIEEPSITLTQELMKRCETEPELWELLGLCRYLIDGRYVHEQRDLTLHFRGSRNQRIIDLPASLPSKTPVVVEL